MKRKFENKNTASDLFILFTIITVIIILAFSSTLNILSAKDNDTVIKSENAQVEFTVIPVLEKETLKEEVIFNNTNNEPSQEVKGVILEDAASDEVTSMEKLNNEIYSLINLYKTKGLDTAGIEIKDTSTGEKIEIDSRKILTAASLYKIYVLWKLQEDIETGKITNDTGIVLNYLNDDSSEDGFKLGNYGDTIKVSDAKNLMITRSNNTASLALAYKLGWENIQKLLDSNNYKDTDIYPHPTTSSYDIFRVLEGMLNKNLSANLKDTDYEEMLNLLSKQRISTNLSQGLPKEAIFAHKTGNLAGYVHDAGILSLPNGKKLIISVMTNGDDSAIYSFQKSIGQLIWKNFAS